MAHGNVVHMFERDCSLQRRHQKVIEEAPAPGMPEDVRSAMGAAAVEAARAIGYQGAGTVEFIADGSEGLRADRFWFMEMNTRLQVEHPVSEAITGLDFVALQLRVAAGRAALPVAQEDLAISGHAFEARIYAEDAGAGFLPSTGVLDHLAFPGGVAFARGPVRIDTGVRGGDEISPFYDPMIAKLIVAGASRAEALARLRAALAETHVAGVTTNVGFLAALAAHDGFGRGEVDTGLIERDMDGLIGSGDVPDHVGAVAAVASLGLLEPPASDDPWDAVRGWRHWSDARMYARLIHGGDDLEWRVESPAPDRFRIGGAEFRICRNGTRVDVETGGRTRHVSVAAGPSAVTVFADARTYRFERVVAGLEDDGGGGDVVAAPMPGQVKAVVVEPGASVVKGDALMVLEAMKMEHTLVAPRDGVVAEVMFGVDAQVSDGAVMVRLEPEHD